MSHTLTPVAKVAAVEVPDDGEAAAATAPGTPASRVTLEEVVQSLLNNTAQAQAGWHGFLDRRELVVTSSGIVRVGPFGRLVLARSTGEHDVFESVATSSVTLPSLALDTHYYVYAWNDAGTLAWLVSSTVPDDALMWKSDDAVPTHRYIGSFWSLPAVGVPCPQVSIGGRCWYTDLSLTVIQTAIGGSGVQSFAHHAPPIARLIHVEAWLFADSVDAQATAHVGPRAATVAQFRRISVRGSATGPRAETTQTVAVPVDRSSLVHVELGANASEIWLQLLGWEE